MVMCLPHGWERWKPVLGRAFGRRMFIKALDIVVNGPRQVHPLWGIGSVTRSHRHASHCRHHFHLLVPQVRPLYLRLDLAPQVRLMVLLDGDQLSSLSLPGGSAVL